MLEAMYAKELDKETLAKIAELKKTDPKAAAELSRERLITSTTVMGWTAMR